MSVLPIGGPGGDDPAYTAAGIFYIPSPTRDDVYVRMVHGLTGCFTDVDPDVETVHCWIAAESLLDETSEFEDGLLFELSELEEVGLVALGDDQGVAFGERVAVREGGGQVVLLGDLVLFDSLAEGAVHWLDASMIGSSTLIRL
jgi:hypothetical protein